MPAAKARVTRPCATCGATLVRLECQFLGAKAYCNRACADAGLRHGSTLKCEGCGAEFYRRFGEQDVGIAEKQFCSRPCYQRFREIHRKASVYPKRGPVHVHRLVAAAMLGRPLRDGEVVHHIDANKHNNDPRNLCLFPSHRDHMRAHHGKMSEAELRRYRLAR